ncbi:MAG TPA: hypothetical protein VN577_17450 [Terriglobales bacterium]|nr:hypothetical protein [Terriglobales bacterium]
MSDQRIPSHPEEESSLGFTHENLEGWIPSLASENEIRLALEKAFDYRGDITITLKSGEKIEGYLYDRKAGKNLDDSLARIMPKDKPGRMNIRYSDVAALAFSGKDTAAGKSFEAWIKKYNEKKAAGETNIGIEAEPLD